MISTPSQLRDRLLLVNPGAGSVTAEVESRLREAFPDHHYMHFPPGVDIRGLLSEGALVVAAGGDGTIGAVARALTGSDHPFGILSLGTYNNFARSLGLPLQVDEAIAAIKNGQARPVTMGKVNGRAFVEGAAIGLFGDVLSFGDAAKSHSFGEMRSRVGGVLTDRPFRFQVRGDIEMRGRALSLIGANTSSIGAHLRMVDKDPELPFLELHVSGGRTPLAGLGEMLKAALCRESRAAMARRRQSVPLDLPGDSRFRRIEVTTDRPAHVFADLDYAGQTPAVIEALPGGLNVILPA